MPLAVVILAAGQGKRMNNPAMAKVLYPVAGRPMIDYVLDRACGLDPVRIAVVVGHQHEAVTAYVRRAFADDPRIAFVHQTERLGTGHAVLQCADALRAFAGDVLVLSGDVPLLTSSTLELLVRDHRATGVPCTMVTAVLDDPAGYGRIVRGADGMLDRIVEQRDATDAERRITEVNTGIYVFDKEALFDALQSVTAHNAQGEYYLTDVIGILRARHAPVATVQAASPLEVLGVNTPEQLAELDRLAAG